MLRIYTSGKIAIIWQGYSLLLLSCRGIYDAFKTYVGLPTTGGAAPPEKKGEKIVNKIADKVSA